MVKPYFTNEKEDPEPLVVTVQRRVRFEETDPLGIVWPGRYSSYFEDARAAVGEKYGIGYMDFYRNETVAPLRIFHTDFLLPIGFQEDITIDGILRWSEAARINFEYTIRNSRGEVTTRGYSVQVMLDLNNNLLLIPPRFYEDFLLRWKEGRLR